MGFLDMFDDPNILQALLGGGGVGGGAMSGNPLTNTPPGGGSAPPPPPPQVMGASAPAAPAPSGPPTPIGDPGGGVTAMPGAGPQDPMFPLQPPGPPPNMPPAPPVPGLNNPMPMAPPQGPLPNTPGSPMASIGGAAAVPMTLPGPGQFPNSAGSDALPPNSSPTIARSLIATPKMAPPGDPTSAPPMQGGLASALGLNPVQAGRDLTMAQPNPLSSMLSGVGKGLSAVGQQKPGTPKGYAIAAGAGGGISGTLEDQEKQKNTLFAQSSKALEEMRAQEAAGNTAQLTAARAAFLTARAQSTALMTGKGGNAWQNTPLGQVATIEQRVAAFDGGRRKSIDAAVRAGTLTADDAKSAYSDLENKTNQFRTNMYKSAGLDPKQAEKMRTAGTEDNPFDTNGMSLDQFHAQVPMGAFYTDQKGAVRQRTQPPPGSAVPGQQSEAQPTAGDYAAEQMALNG